MASVSEPIVGKDVNGLLMQQLLVKLKYATPRFKINLRFRYQALADKLGVPVPVGEGGMKRVCGLLPWDQRSLDLATEDLVREWIVKKERDGEAPRLHEFLKALDAVGLAVEGEGIFKEFGVSEMFQAIKRCDPASVQELLETTVGDANARNSDDQTPLLAAAEEARKAFGADWLTIIKLLIESGADVHVLAGDRFPNAKGETFLHRLLETNTYQRIRATISPEHLHELVEFLVKKGLINIFNIPSRHGGITPLHYAVESVDVTLPTLDLLHRNGVDFTTLGWWKGSILSSAIVGRRRLEVLSWLTECGANYKKVDRLGHNLLHEAVMWGHVEALKFFIAKGLKVDQLNGSKMTPLHSVAFGVDRSRGYECVQVLLKHGAKKTLMDRFGRTPYDVLMAEMRHFPNREETLQLLRP